MDKAKEIASIALGQLFKRDQEIETVKETMAAIFTATAIVMQVPDIDPRDKQELLLDNYKKLMADATGELFHKLMNNMRRFS